MSTGIISGHGPASEDKRAGAMCLMNRQRLNQEFSERGPRACSVPVAFVIFNRPDLTAQVFERIRKARPRQLFLIADGPRTPEDAEKCARAREIAQQVDWDCEVERNFSDTNLGCGRRPASGLDWVFSRVEQAIILEDDCVPAPSFFEFCESLLSRYRDDERVMHISGDSFQLGRVRTDCSYYFSKYTHSCGWATWRRAWKHYDYEIKGWEEFKRREALKTIFPDPFERAFWIKKCEPFYRGTRDDAWDYQWNCALWMRGGLSIFPAVNLVSNLGWRADGTHTRETSRWANLPTGEINEIVHPPAVAPNHEADAFAFDEWFGGRRLRERRTWRYRLSKPLRVLNSLFQPKPIIGEQSLKTSP